MALPVEINPLHLQTSGGYSINKSLRFRSSATAYLNRTFGATGNQQKFTYSIWTKRGALASGSFAGSGWSGSGATQGGGEISFTSDQLNFNQGTNNAYDWRLLTNQVFRDPSSWYHIVIAVDTTQATAANRILIYVNGVQVTSFSSATYPTLNLNTKFNATNQRIGAIDNGGTAYNLYDGYLAEVNFVDGQALAVSSFGAYDTNGVWQPKKYTGTYGTNGFYLPFGTTTSTATLGNDSSGNGNTWTVNNISLTAGTTYDSMTDSPTVSSATVANYATLNPIGVPYNTGTAAGGNLNWTGAATADKGMAATISMSSGKWYWECTVTATGAGSNSYVGIVKTAGTADSSANRIFYRGDGAVLKYGVSTTGLTTYTTGDVIGIAYDYTAQTLAFYKNNTLVTTVTSVNLEPYLPWVGSYTTTESWAFNAGQRPFTYSAPTGFNALNTYNLPTPTIANGAQYMAATLYTGNGSTLTINNGTNTTIGTTFQPDFAWLKSRSAATSNSLSDVLRGIGVNSSYPRLISDSTAAESTNGGITSFASTGLSLNADAAITNTNAATYVAWQWKANGSGVSNTNGSITSTVSANTTAGFSVVTYTGTGASNPTIGHGLGVTPNMIILKDRNTNTNNNNWQVYHSSLTSGYFLSLNATDAQAAISGTSYGSVGQPTSTTFKGVAGSVDSTTTNQNTQLYVAYCWAAVAGYSAFGSYTGNGSTDGPFVYTGFRPRWILIRSTSVTRSWLIDDTSINPYNTTSIVLAAQSSSGDNTGNALDMLSNGFKPRDTWVNWNASGETFIYAAFAENPFNSSRAR